MSYYDSDEKKKKKTKYTIIFLLASFGSLFVFFPLLATQAGDPGMGIFAYVGFIAIYLVWLTLWYKKSIEKLEKSAIRDYTLKEHIMAHGEVFIGEVVHVKEKDYVVQEENESVLVPSRALVVRFVENNEQRFIVRPRFDHNIKIIDTEKQELKELYGTDSERIGYLMDKTINLRQFIDRDGCITFEDDGSDLSTYFYEGSIEKNYEDYYTCKVYKYKNRYVVGDIEEFDYVADEKEKVEIKRERMRRNRIEKEKVIFFFIIMFLLFLMSEF